MSIFKNGIYYKLNKIGDVIEGEVFEVDMNEVDSRLYSSYESVVFKRVKKGLPQKTSPVALTGCRFINPD